MHYYLFLALAFLFPWSKPIDSFNVLFSHREPPIAIKKKAQDAKESLHNWKQSYFEVRARIEASGRDARWEFDRKRLFERTDYMAKICEDIHDIAQVHFFSCSFS